MPRSASLHAPAAITMSCAAIVDPSPSTTCPRAAAAALDRGRGDALAHLCSGAARGGRERRGQDARVDRVVIGDVEREPQRRRQARLEPARLARAQPPDLEPEAQAQLELALERLRLVAVARDQQRPARA